MALLTLRLRIGYWNIEGLQNKLTFQDFLHYISSIDIFAVSETWDENSFNLCPDHDNIFLPATRANKHGRAMCGITVHVFIRNTLSTFLSQIKYELEIGIAIKMNKVLFN